MNNDLIKQLAKLTVQGTSINRKVAEFALTKLSRKELAAYLRVLKSLVAKNMVSVASAVELPGNLKKIIEKKFSGKRVVFLKNTTIGDGIKIQINDSVIDLTLKGFIDQTYDNLKSEI